MGMSMKRCIGVLLILCLVAGAVCCGSGGDAQPFLEPEDRVGTAVVVDGAESPIADTGGSGADSLTPGAVGQETEVRGAGSAAAPQAAEAEAETREEPAFGGGPPPVPEPEMQEVVEDALPPVFGLIDAHADTITRALLRDQGLFNNSLHVDFERLFEYGAPVQVFALWCADRYVANAFDYTNSLIDFFESEVAKHSDIIEIALSLEDLERNARNNRISAILSIEGGEALMGDINNLDHFYNRGVRILSLTWNRENELGYGQATESVKGLKPLGVECIKRMEELGIILDISHLNEAGFWDAHRVSTRPYMASHSNAYALTPHNRNLTDEQIVAMVDRGGVIGLALYPLFLSPENGADMGDIMAHISHFISLGAGGNLGFGSDFDGFDTMPRGITDISSFTSLEERIAAEFGEEVSHKIMSGNFYEFFIRYSAVT